MSESEQSRDLTLDLRWSAHVIGATSGGTGGNQMAIGRELFDELQKRWGSHSSWAVWTIERPDERATAHIGELDVLNPDINPALLGSLTPEIVLVGLNASSREGSALPWGNFHDASLRANDYKLRHAAEDTSFWGAYMTDALVNFPETDSARVRTHIKSHPEMVAAQLDRLEDEILSLGVVDPLLVALGGLAYDLLSGRFGEKYRVVKVTHYAHQVSKETLREEMLSTVEATRRIGRPKQFFETRCRNVDCTFEGGKVEVTIDYRTPYETGYSWTCPVCGTKNSSEFSGPGSD
jgi:hypothetical protein